MPKWIALVSVALLPLVMGLGTAFAQAPTGQPSSAKMSRADKEAISKACSEQANAQGLQGKARKKFRSRVQTNPWQSNVVRGWRSQSREVVWLITLGGLPLARRAALSAGFCISSQAHSEVCSPLVTRPWGTRGKFTLAAIAWNLRLLATSGRVS